MRALGLGQILLLCSSYQGHAFQTFFFFWGGGGGLSDEGLGFVWVSAWGLIRTNEKLAKRALQNMSHSCTLQVKALNTSAGIKFCRACLYLYAEGGEYQQFLPTE